MKKFRYLLACVLAVLVPTAGVALFSLAATAPPMVASATQNMSVAIANTGYAATTAQAGTMLPAQVVKLAALSTTSPPGARLISTTAPLSGGGDLTADRTLSIAAATTAAPGSMSAADKTRLDAMGTASPPGTRSISTTAPLSGGGDLSADRTLTIAAATTSAAGSMSAPDKTKIDGLPVVARFASTTALPAYTYVSGTITANANGVMPTWDGVTAAVGDKGLFQHGASNADDGVYDIVSLGSGGTPWSMTRTAALDTAGEFQGTRIIVREGLSRGGATYRYDLPATPTVGTSPLIALRVDRGVGCRECFDIHEDFNLGPSTGTAFPSVVSTSSNGYGEWFIGFTSGTGSITSTQVNDTNAIIGEVTLSVSSLSAQVIVYSRGATIKVNADGDLLFTAVIDSIPTLSNGANNFRVEAGMFNVTAGQAAVTYDVTASNNWNCATNDGTTTQTVTTGPAVAPVTRYVLAVRKFHGEIAKWHCYVDGVEIGTGNATNAPGSTLGLEPQLKATKTLSTSALTALFDYVDVRYTDPKGR